MELNWVNIWLVVLPIVVIGGVFVWLKYLEYRNAEKERQWEMKSATQKEISAIRLRAYERLALMLERTTPEAMVMRLTADNNPALMSVHELQRVLLMSLRAEFDHNMSQQIYVSEEVWDKIILARDEMAAFINSVAIHLAPDATGQEYATTLLTAYTSNGVTPHQQAMEDLKAEVGRLVEN